MKVNINDIVRVQLNEEGEKKLDKYHVEQNELIRKSGISIPRPVPDAEEWYSFQIHEIMRIFGASLGYAGARGPFRGNVIDIPSKRKSSRVRTRSA